MPSTLSILTRLPQHRHFRLLITRPLLPKSIPQETSLTISCPTGRIGSCTSIEPSHEPPFRHTRHRCVKGCRRRRLLCQLVQRRNEPEFQDYVLGWNQRKPKGRQQSIRLLVSELRVNNNNHHPCPLLKPIMHSFIPLSPSLAICDSSIPSFKRDRALGKDRRMIVLDLSLPLTSLSLLSFVQNAQKYKRSCDVFQLPLYPSPDQNSRLSHGKPALLRVAASEPRTERR